MARATHGVSSGSWYYEVTIKPPQNGEDGHVRLGWCTEMGDVQAPVTNRYYCYTVHRDGKRPGARY